MTLATSGLRDPSRRTAPRRAGSVRRTTHLDMRPAGAGSLRLSGAARDLRTSDEGRAEVVDEASVAVTLGRDRRITEIETTPGDAAMAGLVGLPVMRGFRAALDDHLPWLRSTRSPLALLLDELPVAVLISGYAALYRSEPLTSDRLERVTSGRPQKLPQALPKDVCAGWAADGMMMTAIGAEGRIPIPVGPVAPPGEGAPSGAGADELAWHRLDPLAPGAMRRRRYVDLALVERGAASVLGGFRDTHVQPGGLETVLHEYEVEMTVDPRGTVRECRAVPRVLPWPECPSAAASAARLVGTPVTGLRDLVRREFHGTATCTHLNDLLRSLTDVAVLRAILCR